MLGKRRIKHLKNRDGKELLEDYENLDENCSDFVVECYQRAIIEKYADEIGYNL